MTNPISDDAAKLLTFIRDHKHHYAGWIGCCDGPPETWKDFLLLGHYAEHRTTREIMAECDAYFAADVREGSSKMFDLTDAGRKALAEWEKANA